MLTERTIRAAKPRDKQYRLHDEAGLYLQIHPNGSFYWRLRFFRNGKESTAALGKYPDISLAEARELAREAKKAAKEGKSPKRRHRVSTGNSFEVVAREWLDLKQPLWTDRYFATVKWRVEGDVTPPLGHMDCDKIERSDILAAVRKVEGRGAVVANRRILAYIRQILDLALLTDRIKANPAYGLVPVLKKREVKHHAYLREDDLPEYLERLRAYDGKDFTKAALWLLLYLWVRTSELIGARWKEFNFERAEWRIPPERMKMKQEHIVPLSTQAIRILKELQAVSGKLDFVFPNMQKPKAHMSQNTLIFALYRMGYHSRATGHGFRSTASTILNEKGFRGDIIERQLAHDEPNKIRSAYNHAEYLKERREMMQWWADFIDGLAAASTR